MMKPYERLMVSLGKPTALPANMAGLTLIELAVVMLILVALAGMLMPLIQNTGPTAQCVATDASLVAIRDVLLGVGGYRSDLGKLPSMDNPTNSLYRASSLTDLYINNTDANNPSVIQTFNATTQRGWRGPYMTGGMTCTIFAKALSGHLSANLPVFDKYNVCNLSESAGAYTSAWTNPDQHFVALDSFPIKDAESGNVGLPGAPIVLLRDASNGPNNGKYFLVSGGPDGQIGITPANVNTRIKDTTDSRADEATAFDDRVLYLDANNASANRPCSQ